MGRVPQCFRKDPEEQNRAVTENVKFPLVTCFLSLGGLWSLRPGGHFRNEG